MANIFDSESPYVINGQLWVGRNGTQIPNAGLQLGPGTATANSSPLKFTTGTNLTTPEAGAMEFDGTHLYITIGSTRFTLDQQASNPSVPVDITGANANALTVGANGTTNPQFNVDTSVSSVATGLNVKGNAAGSGVTLAVLSSGTNEGLTLDTKGTGVLTLNGTSSSGNVQVGGGSINPSFIVDSALSTAMVVGPNGATNPVLTINTATASQASGLQITGAATGVAVALLATDSGSNVGVTFDGKGTGTIGINTVSTTSGLVTIGNSTSNAGLTVNGPVNATGLIKSSSATGGIGYATGAGGTVTQLTSRTTGVTLNKVSGQITMFSAAGSATAATFTVTNSSVAATDTIILNQVSGTNLYELFVTAVTGGTFNVTFLTTGGTATDAPVINFTVIKGVTS